MSLAKIKSMALNGIDGYIVTVEVDTAMGLPSFDIVGLPDTAVKESKERVRAAIKNCGFNNPVKRITVNLAPADRKKAGPSFDLPITVALLKATEQIDSIVNLDECGFIGELSLDGKLRPVNGILPMAICAKENGIKRLFLPEENSREAAVVEGIDVFGVDNLLNLVKILQGEIEVGPVTVNTDEIFDNYNLYDVDFSDVKGQPSAKRALEVAVAGGHNIIMIGSPGSGKSMLARRIPTILPDLTTEEALEVTKIHSVAGILESNSSLIRTRPFRSPHHTVSSVGLIGGGTIPKPGEISLAHNGVLFLDELPEFHRDSLEAMRQPLEDGKVTISRVNASLTYPADILLVASMNPCPCGYYGDSKHNCTCTPPQITRYMSKISGPLLDRIDIHIDVPSVSYNDLQSDKYEEKSADIRERVNKARNIQIERYKNDGILNNSQLTAPLIRKYCKLGTQQNDIMKKAFDIFGLSARAHDRILKVARTIADLDQSESIQPGHLMEAIQYRTLDRKYWEV